MRNYTILLLTVLFFSCTKEKNYDNQNSLNPTFIVEKITASDGSSKDYFYDSIGRIKLIKFVSDTASIFPPYTKQFVWYNNYFYNDNSVTIISDVVTNFKTLRLNLNGFSDSTMTFISPKGRWVIFTNNFDQNDLLSNTKVYIYDTIYGKHGNDNLDKSYTYTYKYFPNNIAEKKYVDGTIDYCFLLKKDNELYETNKLEYFTNLSYEHIHDVNYTTKKLIDTNDPNSKILEYTWDCCGTRKDIYTVYMRKK
ncbi:MAG: hypothetical protein ACOYMA_01900 [Bacteroidia bacterium]